MLKHKKALPIILLSVVVLLVIFSPTLVQGKEKITNIWAGTGEGGKMCNERGMTCTFCDGIIVTTNIIELLLLLGLTLGVLIILYGGVRLMTSGGSQTQIKEAKDIIVKAIIGVVIVSCAWIIVDTIFKTFAKDSKWNALDFIGCGSSDLKIAQKGTLSGEGNNNALPPVTVTEELIVCTEEDVGMDFSKGFTLGNLIENLSQVAKKTKVCRKVAKSCNTPDIKDKTAFGFCNPDNFKNTCFDDVRNDAAVMCYIETGGGKALDVLSGSDVCQDGTSFSGGMAQINFLYHNKSMPKVCQGLFWTHSDKPIKEQTANDKRMGDCLKRNTTNNACIEYNCGLNKGEEKNYQKCIDTILSTSYQIDFACNLYLNRSPNNCWADWPYTYKHCKGKVTSQECDG